MREEDINSDYVMFVDSCKRREKGEDLKNDFNKKIANNLAEKIMVYSYIRQCWYRGVIIRTDDGKFSISYDMDGKKFRFQFYIVKNVNKGSYNSKEVSHYQEAKGFSLGLLFPALKHSRFSRTDQSFSPDRPAFSLHPVFPLFPAFQ